MMTMFSKKNLFWCFVTALLSCTYLVCSQSLDDDLENLINEIFAQDNNQPDRQCSQIEQELRGCHDCYPCNHSVIAHYDRRMTEVRQISLINAACAPTKVCCVSQSVLVLNRISPDACGRRVETGRRRSKPRSILHGEYPWQAHVFQKKNRDTKFLCAATLIDADARALITSAGCVRGASADSLYVTWDVPADARGKMAVVEKVVLHEEYRPGEETRARALVASAGCVRGASADSLYVTWDVPADARGKMAVVEKVVLHEGMHNKRNTQVPLLRSAHRRGRALVASAGCVRGASADSLYVTWDVPADARGKMAVVEKVVMHEGYKPDTKHNDIAVIKLRSVSDIPEYAAPICLPTAAPPNGIACATVATNDYRINTFIPQRKVCTTGKGVPLDSSQICASTVGGGDYFPRQGAALMCQPPRSDNDEAVYVLYGIASFSVNDSLSIYTNVAEFLQWLAKHI
ncbi:uncharacterized protein LOC105396213 [Plutella xylostella]|uniref:uncharacterized protein LOC105396213 n=1 Tax=Plutella xylostella TaxID=51655 RepID=UPI002032E869|nr:uncharacterized protein LOC105396213 [Plutella xylostella]